MGCAARAKAVWTAYLAPFPLLFATSRLTNRISVFVIGMATGGIGAKPVPTGRSAVTESWWISANPVDLG